MNFDFSDDQRQLQDLLARYTDKEYGFERYRATKATGEGWCREVWQGLAELGVLASQVPEAQGGLGQGPMEALVIMNQVGPALLLEPVLSSAVIASHLLAAIEDASAAALLEKLALGESIAVLAHQEPQTRDAPAGLNTRAVPEGEHYRLDGHKAVVSHAPMADVLLVSAQTDEGVSLFQVPSDAPGLSLQSYPTLDGHRAAEVRLQAVSLHRSARLGPPGKALAPIGTALDVGLAAVCGEAVGILQALVDATAEYLRTRKQFGQALGRFQALQHRVADMLLCLEQARSMSYLAAARCRESDAGERARVLSAAKVVVGQACRYVSQQAVQLHGGMGMSDELQVSHWFKRLTAIELLFGDTDTHLQRFAQLSRRAAP